MTTSRFIWNITQTKKVKIKEIREYSIVWNVDANKHDVLVFGFFGGGVAVYSSESKEECRRFIKDLTEGKELVEKEDIK